MNVEEKENSFRNRSRCSISRIKYLLVATVVLVTLSMLAVITSSIYKQEEKTSELLSKLGGSNTQSSERSFVYNGEQTLAFQDCDSSYLKLSFPNLDYALQGYNILKGYPESQGHDPGFAFAIFKADYTTKQTTADCRYRIPASVTAVPDVSCVTSFSSTIIQTSYEFEKHLSLFTSVEGRYSGKQFSASSGYKLFTSSLSNSEYVYILSTAHCRYYHLKLNNRKLPQFSSDFIDWVHRLDGSCNEDLYYEFIDHFGTHFPVDVIFGAKYTIENKMKSTSYESFKKQNINVAITASYSALILIPSFKIQTNIDFSQSESVSKFQKEVSISTVAIGAPPPADGSAITWASVVKDDPIPIQYKLSPITELFTEVHMSDLGINYGTIRRRLEYFSQKYCSHLLNTGKVSSCSSLYFGLDLTFTRMHGHTRSIPSLSFTECLNECLNHVACEAISYCIDCTSGDSDYESCYMFAERNDGIPWSSTDEKWTSFVFTSKIKTQLVFKDVTVIGTSRESNEGRASSLEECKNRCLNTICAAFTYCLCAYQTENCLLYADDKIIGFKHNTGFTLSIIPAVDFSGDVSSKTCENL